MKHALFAVLMTLSFGTAAQLSQTKDCSKGCDFVTDPVAVNAGTNPTACLLVGFGSAPISKPVVEGTTLSLPAGKTCYWPGVVMTPGNYSMTAVVVDASGKQSAPSLPLTLTVESPTPAAATGLRVLNPVTK